jgi:glycosyltransferase involved in cell wall biosynthesis
VRAAFLTRYTASTASSRVRVFQYVPYLEEAGIEVRTLSWTVSSRRELARYALRAIGLARWADVLVVQKPCQPPWLIEALSRANNRLVVDFDDAIWAAEPDGRTSLYGDRLQHTIGRACLVTTGSEYLMAWVGRECPGVDVEIIRSSVDLEQYTPADRVRDHRTPIIGWIGSPGNLVDFTSTVTSALRALVEAGRGELKVVSSRPLRADGLPSLFEPWSLEGEVSSLRDFDIGIMPLADNERSRGRCGFKVVQYMAVGAPVVASPVGGAVEVVDQGVTGFLAGSAREWRSCLEALIQDSALRATLGAAGRRRVEEQYSLQANLPRLLAVLERARRQ